MKKILILAAIILLASGCVKRDDFSFNGIDNVNVSGISLSGVRVDGDINITNSSRKKLTLSDVDIVIYDGTSQIATATLEEPVSVERRSDAAVKARLIVRFSSSGGAFALLGLQNRLDKLYISGTLKAKVGALSRKMEVEKMPITEFMHNLDIK